MQARRARVLIVDDSDHSLSPALEPGLLRHDLEIAAGAPDAIRRIDCAARCPHDVILCDPTIGDDLPGLDLWAYLTLNRTAVAHRRVFVTSPRLPPRRRVFLSRIPNLCIERPVDGHALDALVNRRATGPGVAWTRFSDHEGSRYLAAPAKASA